MLAFLASLASSLARIHEQLIELKVIYTSEDLIEVYSQTSPISGTFIRDKSITYLFSYIIE